MSLTPLVPLIPTSLNTGAQDTSDSFSIAPLSPLSTAETVQGTSYAPTSQIPAGQLPAFGVPLTNSNGTSNVTPVSGSSIGTSIVDYLKNNPISSALDFLTGQQVDPTKNDNELEDIIFIVLGFLLIGAGVFSFRSTGNVIKVVANVAAKTGEIAA